MKHRRMYAVSTWLSNLLSFMDICNIIMMLQIFLLWGYHNLISNLLPFWSDKSACTGLGLCRQNVVAAINGIFFHSCSLLPNLLFCQKGLPRNYEILHAALVCKKIFMVSGNCVGGVICLTHSQTWGHTVTQ